MAGQTLHPDATTAPGAGLPAAVLAQSRSALALADDDGVLREVNRAASQLLRLPRAALAGTALDALSAPHERAATATRLRMLLERDAWEPGSTDLMLADGRRIEVHAQSVPDEPASHLLALRSALPRRFARRGIAVARGGVPARPSERELQVVRMLADGLTGEQIAQELMLSPETVRSHLRNVMGKLGAGTRPHLVALAVQDGWISL
jgi:LuxR family transcriptional regulator, maltose regulon positive regulatory protein